MVSIIIPAHNEEKCIGSTLRELMAGVNTKEIEIVVVCNGCDDNTASIVASFGSEIICIETPIPSKTNALNMGDSVAKGFPRIYLDADVVLPLQAVRLISKVLTAGRFLAAAPKMKMELSRSSLLVRSYYDVWTTLPYVRQGMIGTGVFALSEDGRKRFDKFPPIIADDGYIRSLFNSHERTTINSCYSIVRAPSNLYGLIKIKTRSRLGYYELKYKFPELPVNENNNYCKALLGAIGTPYMWPKAAVYLYVNLATRVLAQKHAKHYGFTGWERDDSSRKRD